MNLKMVLFNFFSCLILNKNNIFFLDQYALNDPPNSNLTDITGKKDRFGKKNLIIQCNLSFMNSFVKSQFD